MTDLSLKPDTTYLDTQGNKIKITNRVLLSLGKDDRFLCFQGYPVPADHDTYPEEVYTFTDAGKSISGLTTTNGFVKSPDLVSEYDPKAPVRIGDTLQN